MPDTQSLRVSPCLFIGIGTTGLNIVEDLRQLFYEEFGVGGLHCFRYLVLETDKRKQSDDNFIVTHPAEMHEQINLLPVTIHDVESVEIKAGMEDWLDRRLLRCGQKSFEAGAGAFRQAGRLCVWENWEKVRAAINNALDDICTGKANRDTDKFLRDTYFGKKKRTTVAPDNNLVDSTMRVYLCGTLCGGTCSGAFLDLAYFLWKRLGVRYRTSLNITPSCEVVGVFTVPTVHHVDDTNYRQRVANTWAALHELDFYYQPTTFYRAQFPGGLEIETKDYPFDTLYLESMMNQAAVGFTADDERALTRMCAMNLFTDVVAGMAAKKAEIRADFRRATDYLRPNALKKIRGYSSFGLSAIWYPRYRIAVAINRRLGEETAADWIGTTQFNQVRVERDADETWRAAAEQAKGSLLGTVEGGPLEESLPATLTHLFEQHEGKFRSIDLAGLGHFIAEFPGDATTLSQKLNQGGQYYDKILKSERLVANALRGRLEGAVVEYLRTHTVAETLHFAQSIIAKAEESERGIQTELPVFSQNMKEKLDLADDVYDDFPTKALGLRQASIREFKSAVWNELKKRALNHLNIVGEHFFKLALQEIMEDLRRHGRRVAAAGERLRVLQETCQRERHGQETLRYHANILPISEGDPEEITDDVRLNSDRILQGTPAASLRRMFAEEEPDSPLRNPLDLLEQDTRYLVDRVDRRFDHLSQQVVGNFHIGSEALQRLSNRLENLVKSCQPYFTPTATYSPMVTNRSTALLFCQEQVAAARLAEAAGRHLQAQNRFQVCTSPLDHFVIFYDEAPGLAISDLAIAQPAQKILTEAERILREDQPTNFTHKLGLTAFDAGALSEFEEAKQWVKDAYELASKEAFEVRNQEECLTYQDAGGMRRSLFVKRDEQLRDFLSKYGLARFTEMIKEKLKSVGRDAMNLRVARINEGITDNEQLKIREGHYSSVLDKIFGTPASP